MKHQHAVTLLMSTLLAAGLVAFGFGSSQAEAAKLKNIAQVAGIRDNQLVGYGVVIGLNGTGDRPDMKFTAQSLTSMLSRFGIRIDQNSLRLRNVAAVMVTADINSFDRIGQKKDVVVSSIGNATNLQGGTLLVTPLRGVDGEVYALAQGPISVGGFSVNAFGSSRMKNHVTAARIPDGATVERSLAIDMNSQKNLVFQLDRMDFTTSTRVMEAINAYLQGDFATTPGPGSVAVDVPEKYASQVVRLVSELEDLDVVTSRVARVVVNERTGTVVIGAEVSIAAVAVAHGSFEVRVDTQYQVSQPNSSIMGPGETVVVPQTNLEAGETPTKLTLLQGGTTIGQLVNALNTLGVAPRDLISILQAIKAAGALEAELVII